MDNLLTVIPTSVAAFAATNIDDIAILILLFSQVNANFRHYHVVAGQYLGFSALVGASLLGFFGGMVLPHHWLGLLGLIPIGMGLGRLFDRGEDATDEELNLAIDGDGTSPHWMNLVGPQSLSVAAITIANGSDNVGIYTPLFSHSSVPELILTILVFLVLVPVWCYIAHRLTHQAQIADWLAHRGQTMVPLVLIALGIYIILDSGAMSPGLLAASCTCLVALTWRPQQLSEVPEKGDS